MDLGINIWGADTLENGKYLVATKAEIDYFAAKGFSHIRLPFSWEAIQPKLNGALDSSYVAMIRGVVEYAKSQGLDVILDVHNYGKYAGKLIGSTNVPSSSFADLWGKIATEFADDTNVKFGLMNEPQQETAAQWLGIANEAIAAIREAGAVQQILVPGAYWTGAWSWTGSDNDTVIGAKGAVIDPAHNFAFEVHQYLDDTSGQNAWVVSETIGSERLVQITEWARANDAKLYLGEFGVANNAKALAALDNMLKYLSQNDDVWQSASYWVAGSANPTYMYTVEPKLGILDVPQMDVLENWTGATVVETVLSNGNVQHNVYVPGRAIPTMTDVLTKSGVLVSRALYDANGDLRSKAVIGADGKTTVTTFSEPGESYPFESTVYNVDQQRIQKTVGDDAGIVKSYFYEPGAHDAYRQDVYKSDGKLDYVIHHSSGLHIYDIYQNGAIAKIETYSASWVLLTRDTFDTLGRLTQRQTDNADGTHEITNFNAKTGLIQNRIEYSSAWKSVAVANFDKDGHPVTRSETMKDGSRVVDFYVAGTETLSRTDTLTSDGKLLTRLTVTENGTIFDTYRTDGSAKISQSVESSKAGNVLSVTKYDGSGLLKSIERHNSDNSLSVETYSASHQTHPETTAVYVAGALISLETLNFDGKTLKIVSYAANGSTSVQYFDPATAALIKYEAYSSSGRLIERTQYDANDHLLSRQKENVDGTHVIETYIPGNQAHPTYIDSFDTSWKLVSRTHLDQNGLVKAIDAASKGGINTITGFFAGTDHVSSVEVYINWQLQSRTLYDQQGNIKTTQIEHADGSREIRNYVTDHQAHPVSIDTFDASWKLVSRTHFDDNGSITSINAPSSGGKNTITNFTSGTDHVSSVDVYVNSQLQTSTVYNEQGKIASVRISNADGSHDIQDYVGDQPVSLMHVLSPTEITGQLSESMGLTTIKSMGISGNTLSNVLIGNSGANLIDGKAGADKMIGGDGSDIYIVDNTGDYITELTNGGTDTVQSSVSYALGAQLENLTLTGKDNISGMGNSFNNIIIGNSGNNVLDGAAGADRLSGGSGDDLYFVDNIGDIITELANGGTDRVQSSVSYGLGAQLENLTLSGSGNINGAGNSFANTIIGNTGTNVISGKTGNDTLTGGAGKDSFFFNTAPNSSSNNDIITDFNVTDDTIRLHSTIYTALTKGVLSANQFVMNTTGLATNADHRIVYETDTGNLIYDSNGNSPGGSVIFATIGPNLNLTNLDIFIV